MTLSLPLQEFVATVDRLLARDLALPALLDWLTPEFRRLLAEPALLSPEQERPAVDGYAQHLLHACEAGRFSLISLVWRPGDQTPIHDHLAWGLAGVYRGCERETRYAWCDRAEAGPGLRPAETQTLEPGEVVPIVPPSDIHRVANADATPTLSLHLYGLDVRATPRGSSVRRVYPRDLVLATPSELAAVAS